MALGRLVSCGLVLAAASGCDGCSCNEVDVESAAAPATEVLEDALPADVAEAAELGVDVMGLRLGAPVDETTTAWLEARGIPCSAGIDEERSLRVTECRDIEGPVPCVLRSYGGDIARVILEETLDSTLVSVSVRRRHSAVTSGYADYGPTCEELALELGPGSVSGGFDFTVEGTEPSRETTSWSNERFSAEVEVLRGMGPVVMVTETWRWHGDR